MLASLIEYNIGHIIVASDLANITVSTRKTEQRVTEQKLLSFQSYKWNKFNRPAVLAPTLASLRDGLELKSY